MSGWWVYILRCGDGTLYTGMTDDPERRLAAHRSGHGAKYTRGRGPLELVYSEACGTRGDALRREAAIKRLPRAKNVKGPFLFSSQDFFVFGWGADSRAGGAPAQETGWSANEERKRFVTARSETTWQSRKALPIWKGYR